MTLADLIKPLVWETSHQTTTPIHVAQSVFGKYSVHGGAWGNGLFPLNIPGVLASSWHESIEAAQAAAQADYAARILSAIDPDAIAALIKVEEALTPFDEMAGEMFARNWNDDGVAISFITQNGPLRITFKEFRAVRAAMTEIKKLRGV